MEQKRDEAFASGEYRRVIAWSERLEREGPMLRAFFDSCPGRRILDLGCGSGEHAAFAAELGHEAVGVDQSEAQIESARELIGETAGDLKFIQSEFSELPSLFDEPFDGAICLGNVIPYLGEEQLEKALAAWSSCLRAGAGLLMQWLNYTHLRAGNVRHLPINIRPGDAAGEEIALVRLMRFVDDKHVVFFPTTLDLPAEGDEGATLRRARAIHLRSWTHQEMIECLGRAGFDVESVEGGVQGEEFEPELSKDVVLRARRAS
ncbi:MAG TPA: class I SAM-dependent methyltransferase [Candidatus Krumholzibacteria bacterium]|jgi:SAM-dependent methyltransferase